MIWLPAGTSIWIKAGVTDIRRGLHRVECGSANDARTDPYSGHVFVFRGKRGDLVKLLWWTAMGYVVCLAPGTRSLRVPAAENGAASLIRAQLSMLLEGIDWRSRFELPNPR